MRKFAMLSVVMALVCSATVVRAAEEWKMPAPTNEHKWLERFVGDWVCDVSIYMAPGKPPMKAKATETFKKIGGFWVVGEGKGEMAGMKHNHVFTVGYDVNKKKYVGTWIDSNVGTMWQYEGLVSGN